MSYPGNPSLSPDVRQRIVETWKHTRAVAAEGKREEAKLGCDFILRLDPLFTPAQRLGDRLEGADGPVDVSDLLEGSGEGPEELPDLEELPELPMEEVADAEPTAKPAGEIQGEPASASDLRSEIAELVASRDFTTLMRRAQEEHDAIAADSELQRLLGEAQEKMEAAPYVESFLEQAETAVESGDEDEARAALEKARALDADHPRVQALDATLGVAVAGDADEVEAFPGLDVGGEALADEVPETAELEMEGLPEIPDLDVGGVGPAEAPDLGEGFGLSEEWQVDSDAGEEAADAADADSDDAISLEGLGELPPLDEGPGGGPEAGAASEEPSGEAGPSDPDPRVAELLDEGQASFDRGEYQGAIDAWSRIFLIDIDHQEAARRIELARERKSEEDRKVEESYHEALTHAEAGEMDEAREKLQQVLALAPNHVAAAQYLEKLEKGELAPEDVSGLLGEEDELPTPGAEGSEVTAPSHPMAEVMVPPAPGEKRAAPPSEPQPKHPAPGSRRSLVLTAAALVLVAAAVGGFLWYRSGSLFPNTTSPEDHLPLPVQDSGPIERATQLFEEGRAGVAIAQLKRIPPASPHYDEAQALLSRWEASEPEEATLPAESARRDFLLAEASTAFEEGRFLEAIPLYEEAGAIRALEPDTRERLDRARSAVRPLESQITLVRSGEYERVLRDLWLLREQDRDDRVVVQLIAASYYNLGVRSLQQGRPGDAVPHFQEVLNVTPEDEAAARLLDLARTYDGRSQDLLYRIYVKYLAPRAL